MTVRDVNTPIMVVGLPEAPITGIVMRDVYIQNAKQDVYKRQDVQDGMEESISGGRRKQYARPTINSYMYGNAKALSLIGIMTGDEGMAMRCV